MVQVDAEQGQRLDNFLLGRLKDVPRSRIYRMLRRGEVRVNGSRVLPGYRLCRGDTVRVPPHWGDIPRPAADAAPRRAFEELLNRVLYQDDDLIVLDKPSGVAVHGGSGTAYGVIETLRQFDPGTRYELAHRLDRDTSGCLMVAKNRRTLLQLHAQFRAGGVRKRYDLIVVGRWPAGQLTVDKPLARYVVASGERRVRVSATGAPARTDFSVVARLDNVAGIETATWLAAFPKTGRTHQIRVHAAAAGHPIIGDDKYAHGEARDYRRLLLHASELKLTLGDRQTRFAAPLADEFQAFSARG